MKQSLNLVYQQTHWAVCAFTDSFKSLMNTNEAFGLSVKKWKKRLTENCIFELFIGVSWI